MPIPVTLDKTLRDCSHDLIQAEFNKLRTEVRDEVSRKSGELAMRGLVRSGAMVAAIHTICGQQLDSRVGAVWHIVQHGMLTMGVRYSDNLARDLKEFVDYYVPASLWELPGFYEQMGGKELYDVQFGGELLAAREQALKRIHAEIDLYVEGLRAKTPPVPVMSVKERDQKFGILLSPKQAALDFDEWKRHLKSGASIAVLYLDIDNFKDQNTRHTETVVDKTILPEVLCLLAGLVDQRGAAYQQGGDEFVLILPNHDRAEAVAFAEKVRALVASRKFQVGEQAESLTISGGVALWPEHGSTYDDVLAKANLAKREAKEKRNTIILFSKTV